MPKHDATKRKALTDRERRLRAKQAGMDREYALRHNYGLTVDDYDLMFAAQGGVCAICFCPETAKNQHGVIRLSVDHDHDTGQVRGLLCSNCNRAIGLLKDSPTVVAQARDYLQRYQDAA